MAADTPGAMRVVVVPRDVAIGAFIWMPVRLGARYFINSLMGGCALT